MQVTLLKWDFDSEQLIASAARVCHQSKSEGYSAAYLQKIIAMGHESVLEHASVTFEISGISRACSHQLVRHRIASYTQESQRYVGQEDFDYVVPPSVAENEIFYDFMYEAMETYEKLRSMGVPKEDARFVLPNATTTTIIVTMNYRALVNFFRLRLSRDAQWEIRELAQRMFKSVAVMAPNIFNYLAKRENWPIDN